MRSQYRPLRDGTISHASDPESIAESGADSDISPSGVVAPTEIDWLATGSCFAFPALGGLLFGYDIGATSGALVSLTSPEFSGTNWFTLSSLERGLVVSMSLFGALGGSLVALGAGNKLGRRTELLAASACYGIGSLVMATAPSLAVLLAGHLGYGLGIGLAMHAAPAYIAETAPPSARGLLISLKEAAIVGGILLGYLTSYIWISTDGGWRLMLGASAPLALLLAIGMARLPESPRWLLLAGKGRKPAEDALRRSLGTAITRPGALAAAIDAIEVAAKDVRAQEAGSAMGDLGRLLGDKWHILTYHKWLCRLDIEKINPPLQGDLGRLLGDKRYMWPLSVGLSLMLFQQITGQPSVLYYAATIFQAAGFEAASDAAGVAVVLGAWKLAMTMVAVLTVDKVGRRPLLLAGVGAMTLSLLSLSSSFGGGLGAGLGGQTAVASAWASVIALLLYVGAYQVSFGPISWLIVGEVFPLAVRGQAIALATFVNFGANFLVSLALPTIQSTIGLSSTYLVFAVISVVAVATIYAIVPETKGKSLEEIEALWGTGRRGEEEGE